MNANLLRLNPEKTKTSILLHALLSGLLPFLLGAATLLNALSPFSIAFMAAVPVNMLLPAVIGVASGIIVFQTEHAVFHIIAAVLFTIMRFILECIRSKRISVFAKCLCCFGISGLCLFFYSWIADITPFTIAILLIELILSTSCIPLFSAAFHGISHFKNRQPLHDTEKIGICLLLVTLICSCTAIVLFKINLGISLCAIIILAMSAGSGVAGGSISGILCGAALCLCNSSFADFAVFLAIAAFLCGMFQHAGKFVQLLVFLTCSVFSLFLMGSSSTITFWILSLFIGCAIYLILPHRVLPQSYTSCFYTDPDDSVFRIRMKFLSNALKDVEDEFLEISEKFDQIDANNITSVYESASNEICKSCPHCLSCWDSRFSEMMDAFHPLTQTLRQTGCITPQTLPRYFTECCRQPEKLCAAINARYRTFRFKEGKSRSLKETRRFMTDGLESIHSLLAQLEQRISSVSRVDKEKSEILNVAFFEESLEPQAVCVFENDANRLCAEVYLNQFPDFTLDALAIIVSEALDLPFEQPQICTAGHLNRLLFLEETPFSLSFEVRQIACGESRICGDSIASFCDDTGNHCFLLSDGMGNGQRAAIDSLMTCSLLKKLLCAGFGASASLRLLNGALRTKSSDESLATVDLLTIDPSTGQAQFFKAGAAISLLYRSRKIKEIKGAALPLGILQDTEISPHTEQLAPDDILILVSDGVADTFAVDSVQPLLNRYASASAAEIAFALCSAISTALQTPCDDITILVIKMEKNNAA